MFSENLKKLRKTLNYSIAQISSVVDVPARSWTAYEREERTPSIDFLQKLFNQLKVNANWLLTGEGEMFNTPPSLKLRKIPLELVFKNFGKKINKLQTENDLSLSDAAEFLNISEDDFVDYCLNRKKPDLDIVVKIINNFDVDFEYFLEQ